MMTVFAADCVGACVESSVFDVVSLKHWHRPTSEDGAEHSRRSRPVVVMNPPESLQCSASMRHATSSKSEAIHRRDPARKWRRRVKLGKSATWHVLVELDQGFRLIVRVELVLIENPVG